MLFFGLGVVISERPLILSVEKNNGEYIVATFNEKTAHLITTSRASDWNNSDEKWCFVTDMLTDNDIGYDPFGNNVDRMVNSIEHRFEKLLK